MDQERNLRPLDCQEVKTMFFPAKNISVVIKMHQHDQYPSGGPSLMSGGTGNDWWVQSMQKNRRKESPTGPAENFPIVPFYWNILRSVQDPPRLFLQLWFEHLISGSNYLHCSKLKKKKKTQLKVAAVLLGTFLQWHDTCDLQSLEAAACDEKRRISRMRGHIDFLIFPLLNLLLANGSKKAFVCLPDCLSS